MLLLLLFCYTVMTLILIAYHDDMTALRKFINNF